MRERKREGEPEGADSLFSALAYPIVPLTDGHGISIVMTTIHGRACFGVYAQAELAADADRIARGINEAIDELLARAQAV